MASILEKIYRRNLVNKNVSEKCIGILKLQRITDRIPKYLPVDIVIAHKTGLEADICHDAGIVFTRKGDFLIKVGDFIIVGDFMGTIEHIGIKTTRIRSLGGEMLIFSNSDLTDSRLRNYKLMEKRRVLFKIGVVYQTPLSQLQEIPKIIKGVITGINDTVFDRAHFLAFGDFSLIFEIVYYVISGDYNKYMDIQQQINFGIMEEFKKCDIQFAYPTQTIYLSQVSS